MPRKPRVVIPENPGELMKLTGHVYAKHKELGAKSPLNILDAPTWDEVGPAVEKALAAQEKIEELERQLRILYGQRDPHLESFTDINRRSRDILLAKHAANPAALGDYGYEVIESAASNGSQKKTAKA